MDPIGLALENFDAVGAWRDKDHNNPIDASANFPGGPQFVGAAGNFSGVLIQTRSNDFLRKRLLNTPSLFALGRGGAEPFDQPAVDKIIADLRRDNARFSTRIFGVVDSIPFQMRRVEPASSPAVDRRKPHRNNSHTTG